MENVKELDISVIIPAHNEAANIGNLVSEIFSLYSCWAWFQSRSASCGSRKAKGIGLYDDDQIPTQSRQATKGFLFLAGNCIIFCFCNRK